MFYTLTQLFTVLSGVKNAYSHRGVEKTLSLKLEAVAQ